MRCRQRLIVARGEETKSQVSDHVREFSLTSNDLRTRVWDFAFVR
jgi:hypothetical protein